MIQISPLTAPAMKIAGGSFDRPAMNYETNETNETNATAIRGSRPRGTGEARHPHR
jgi:hypothetical protein